MHPTLIPETDWAELKWSWFQMNPSYSIVYMSTIIGSWCSWCAACVSDMLSVCSYTGTQVCCDPVRKVSTILLTNRCYKNDSIQSKELIALTRRLFNDAVVQVLH